MKLSRFFIVRAVVIGILIISGLVIWQYKNISTPDTEQSIQKNTEGVPPIFKWKFEQASSMNPDGNPKTNVFLLATYTDGTVENKLIQTSDGSCNELEDKEEGTVSNTTNIQCYYAGLGYTFKITKGETSYTVLRKAFEEGSPEYTPPVEQYEQVAEFPFK